MSLKNEQEYPPKAAAMFDAVIALLNEGFDMNRLTVSDITKKAGIGKGTAYEYFSTKEEIIAGALIYDTRKLFCNLYHLQDAEESFEGKLRVILQWIARDFKESRTFARLVTVGTGSYEIGHSIQESFMNMQEESNEYLQFIDQLLDLGMTQGSILKKSRFEGRLALSSQIVCLMMYLACREMYPEVTEQQAVETAYRNSMLLLTR